MYLYLYIYIYISIYLYLYLYFIIYTSYYFFIIIIIKITKANWANEFSMNNTNFLPAPQLSHEEEKVFENAFNEAIKQHQG